MYLTENWRLKEQRYTLKGSRSHDTHEVMFPPRPVAPRELALYDFALETETNRPTQPQAEALHS